MKFIRRYLRARKVRRLGLQLSELRAARARLMNERTNVLDLDATDALAVQIRSLELRIEHLDATSS